MDTPEYNFKRCKLCGEFAAEPTYDLTDSIIYICHKCDFHFLNRLDCTPGKAYNTTQLNTQNRDYLKSRADENASLHLNRLKFMQRYMDLSGSKILDVGAGLGQFQLLLNAQGAESHGIEPSRIRREYTWEQSGIELHDELVANDYWQKNFTQSFDAITLWDVIEHVNFPRETIESASKLLKPSGILFLDTPSRESLSYKLSQKIYHYIPGEMSLFLPSFYSTAPYGHKQIFTPKQLIEVFGMYGLEIVFSAHSYTNRFISNNKIILAGRKV